MPINDNAVIPPAVEGLKLPAFIDLHPDKSVTTAVSYYTTNEDVSLFMSMLRKFKPVGNFASAGCICSAGEMPLMMLLPRCRRVFALDMHMPELAIAFFKAVALAKLGVNGTLELFEHDTYLEAKPKIRELVNLLPPELKKYIIMCDDDKKFAPTTSSYSYDTFHNAWLPLRQEWHFANPSALRVAARRLDRLTLIHGDLLELAKYGPFDVLYTSNAITYGTRNCPTSTPLTKEAVMAMLKEGGIHLNTCGSKAMGMVDHAKRIGFRGSWTQYAFVKPQVQVGGTIS